MMAIRQGRQTRRIERYFLDKVKMMEWAIQTRGLRRSFGNFEAVRGIDLAVPRGGFYGFLGPNGTGKSTTIKCLTGLVSATAGEIRILGMTWDQAEEIKGCIGVVPEDLALFGRLTGLESLVFVGRIHGLSARESARRSAQLLELMDLQSSAGVVASEYSHGMQKKLALGCALIAAPDLLILDEPFEGIDAVASRQIKNLLADFVGSGGTVFLTSHVLEIVENLCDTIGIIHQGRLVVQGSLEELQKGTEAGSLEDIFLRQVEGQARDLSLDWLGSSKRRGEG